MAHRHEAYEAYKLKLLESSNSSLLYKRNVDGSRRSVSSRMGDGNSRFKCESCLKSNRLVYIQKVGDLEAK